MSSLDVFGEVETGPVRLFVYVEANTTPLRDGVSRAIGEANTDAGTALNSRRQGRVQLSEVRVVVPAKAVQFHLGLIDATGFIDVSRIANDENLFFLGVPFVNNPTIEFPDYSLGVAFESAPKSAARLRFGGVVASSHGLADNPGVSYAQLLNLTEREKGVFAGGAVRWRGESYRVSVGSWVNTAEHPRIDGVGRTESNRGAFAVLGWFGGPHSVSARVGAGNADVSVVRAFGGLTYLWSRGPSALGLAVARSQESDADPTLAPVTHSEAFVRWNAWRDIFVTTSAQHIVNSGFSRGTVEGRVWVLGIRLSAQF